MTQIIKNLPAMRETQVLSLGQKIPWRKERLSSPVFLSGEIPWTEEPCGLQCVRSQRVRHTWVANTFIFTIIHLACISFFNEDPSDILKSNFCCSALISRFHFHFYILFWFMSTLYICNFSSWFYHIFGTCYHMLGIS